MMSTITRAAFRASDVRSCENASVSGVFSKQESFNDSYTLCSCLSCKACQPESLACKKHESSRPVSLEKTNRLGSILSKTSNAKASCFLGVDAFRESKMLSWSCITVPPYFKLLKILTPTSRKNCAHEEQIPLLAAVPVGERGSGERGSGTLSRTLSMTQSRRDSLKKKGYLTPFSTFLRRRCPKTGNILS